MQKEGKYSSGALKTFIRACKCRFSMKWLKSYRNSKSNSYTTSRIQINKVANDYCSYRGYYSRKYEHDFYARKNYLNHVAEKVIFIPLFL
jgi:hypothetical protein